jgi:flagellin-like protein
MKGVSDIIAIILILLITVSLAALAYLWFTGILQDMLGIAGNQTQHVGDTLGTKFKIDAAVGYQTESKVGVVVRNTGTVNLDLQKLATYVNNTLYTGREGLGASLAPGEFVSFNITSVPSGGCSSTLKITVETGAEDTLTIVC